MEGSELGLSWGFSILSHRTNLFTFVFRVLVGFCRYSRSHYLGYPRYIWSLPPTYAMLLWPFSMNNFTIIDIGYLENEKFASQPHAGTLLPLVGTLASGIMYCTGKSPWLCILLSWPGFLNFMMFWRTHCVPVYWEVSISPTDSIMARNGPLCYCPCWSKFYYRCRFLISDSTGAGEPNVLCVG